MDENKKEHPFLDFVSGSGKPDGKSTESEKEEKLKEAEDGKKSSAFDVSENDKKDLKLTDQESREGLTEKKEAGERLKEEKEKPVEKIETINEKINRILQSSFDEVFRLKVIVKKGVGGVKKMDEAKRLDLWKAKEEQLAEALITEFEGAGQDGITEEEAIKEAIHSFLPEILNGSSLGLGKIAKELVAKKFGLEVNKEGDVFKPEKKENEVKGSISGSLIPASDTNSDISKYIVEGIKEGAAEFKSKIRDLDNEISLTANEADSLVSQLEKSKIVNKHLIDEAVDLIGKAKAGSWENEEAKEKFFIDLKEMENELRAALNVKGQKKVKGVVSKAKDKKVASPDKKSDSPKSEFIITPTFKGGHNDESSEKSESGLGQENKKRKVISDVKEIIGRIEKKIEIFLKNGMINPEGAGKMKRIIEERNKEIEEIYANGEGLSEDAVKRLAEIYNEFLAVYNKKKPEEVKPEEVKPEEVKPEEVKPEEKSPEKKENEIIFRKGARWYPKDESVNSGKKAFKIVEIRGERIEIVYFGKHRKKTVFDRNVLLEKIEKDYQTPEATERKRLEQFEETFGTLGTKYRDKKNPEIVFVTTGYEFGNYTSDNDKVVLEKSDGKKMNPWLLGKFREDAIRLGENYGAKEEKEGENKEGIEAGESESALEKEKKKRKGEFFRRFVQGQTYDAKDSEAKKNILIIEEFYPADKDEQDEVEIHLGTNGFPDETKKIKIAEFEELIKEYELPKSDKLADVKIGLEGEETEKEKAKEDIIGEKRQEELLEEYLSQAKMVKAKTSAIIREKIERGELGEGVTWGDKIKGQIKETVLRIIKNDLESDYEIANKEKILIIISSKMDE